MVSVQVKEQDRHLAPFAGISGMPGVEIQAAAVDTFLTGSWLHRPPGWLRLAQVVFGGTVAQLLSNLRKPGISLVALLAFAVADPLGGSGFIAAWVAGATYGRVERSRPGDVHEFAEATGDALTMGSLLLFGIALGPILTRVGWDGVLYAVLSLAVVRLAAVAVSLLGSGLALPSILYLGWFGPRGLATLILTIAVVEGTDLAGASTIAEVALVTVALSVVAHGATSGWGSNAYADWVESQAGDTSLPESRTVQPVRVPRRSRPGTHGQGKH